MSSSSPSPSSSAAASPSATPSTSPSSSSSSPPIFVGFIGISVLTFCLVSIIMWRRLANRARPITPDPDPYIRRPQNNNNAYARWQPEMFDAWMGGRASDDLEWEKSMPFSVTILTDAESNRTSDAGRKGKAGKHRGKCPREKGKEEQDPGNSDLQVAVLVTMPSPFHAQSHVGHAVSRRSLRDELAIGLIEMPWIKEDHHSLKRNAL